MTNSKQKNFILIAFSVVIIFGALFMILWRSSDTPRDQLPVVKPVSRQTQVSEPEIKVTPESMIATETSLPEKTPEPEIQNEDEVADPVQPDKTPMDPEDQPRTFFSTEFTNISSLPEGFVLEDLVLSDDGIQLKPLEEDEEASPRYGVIYSPVQEMQFPCNAVSPLWKEKVSEGTSVFVEVSVSPDGETWGIWHPIQYDDDAGEPAEYYPDGSLNPNFGYSPGGVLCWGMAQFKYFRYRGTLYSETTDSPIFSGFRLFYQDTTLGEGHLAEVGEDIAQE